MAVRQTVRLQGVQTSWRMLSSGRYRVLVGLQDCITAATFPPRFALVAQRALPIEAERGWRATTHCWHALLIPDTPSTPIPAPVRVWMLPLTMGATAGH